MLISNWRPAGVRGELEGDLRSVHRAGQLIVDDVELAVEAIAVGERIGKLRHLQIPVGGDLVAPRYGGDRGLGGANGFAVVGFHQRVLERAEGNAGRLGKRGTGAKAVSKTSERKRMVWNGLSAPLDTGGDRKDSPPGGNEDAGPRD